MTTIASPHVPPHNHEAEASVLGAILLAQGALPGVVDAGLEAQDFYVPKHRMVFEAMEHLHASGQAIDVLTVADQLLADGTSEIVGGRIGVDHLAGAVPAAGNVIAYAQLVIKAATRRRIAEAAEHLRSIAADPALASEDAIDGAQHAVLRLRREAGQTRPVTIGEAVQREAQRQHAISRGEIAAGGILTGLDALDAMTGGLHKGNLVVVAARPSMGKSAVAFGFAANAAAQSHPVLFFPLEMSDSELAQRFIARSAHIDGAILRDGRVAGDAQWKGLMEAEDAASRLNLVIDQNAVTVARIRAQARETALQHGGIGLIVVDYLQLLVPSREHRDLSETDRIGRMTTDLKRLGRELRCPVVVVSQLNREPDTRSDKRPLLADLRSSGNIEQDADVVVMVYRDDYYEPDSEAKGTAELIIRKHRNGGLGTATVGFRSRFADFFNLGGPLSDYVEMG